MSVAIESVSVGGSGLAIEGRFAVWSADEIAVGDSITPELITVGVEELEEVAVCSTDKEGK